MKKYQKKISLVSLKNSQLYCFTIKTKMRQKFHLFSISFLNQFLCHHSSTFFSHSNTALFSSFTRSTLLATRKKKKCEDYKKNVICIAKKFLDEITTLSLFNVTLVENWFAMSSLIKLFWLWIFFRSYLSPLSSFIYVNIVWNWSSLPYFEVEIFEWQ